MADSVLSGPGQAKTRQNKIHDFISLKHIVLYKGKGQKGNLTQSTPDNSNLQGKLKNIRVIGSLKRIAGSKEKTVFTAQ